jgi:uncharacterized membrane protein YgcG
VINMIHDGDAPFGAATKGVQVAVVMVGSIDSWYTPEQFTRGVHDRWGVGDKRKNDGVVVMVAYHDRDIYISVGSGVPAMTDGAIAFTVEAMKAPLRAGQKGKALQDAVIHIGEFVAGTAAPAPASVRTSSSTDTNGVGFWIFFFVACAFIAIVARLRKPGAESRLQRLRDDVAAAHRNEYRATSCPVCFDDFESPTANASNNANGRANEDRPAAGADAAPDAAPATGPPRPKMPLSLPCGHTFCEPCLEEWLKSHNNCPVCRQDCFPNERPPQPQQPSRPTTSRPSFSVFRNRGQPSCSIVRSHRWGPQVVPTMGWNGYRTEFDYRLSRLRTLYPTQITAQTAETLRNSAAQGPEAFSEAVRVEVRRISASRGSSGSSSRSFGGGRSSRGGGGKF